MDIKTRATNILTKPAAEWSVIAAERTTVGELLMGYALPLAGLAAICRFIGQSLIGISMPFMGTIRIGIVRGLAGAIVGLALGLAGAYIAALVIQKLAPTFKSAGDIVEALKLVVFAYTPVWLLSVLTIIPALGVLVILGALYAVYLFYLGLPPVMKTPEGQVIPYMLVSALVIIVINFVLGLCVAAIVGIGSYGSL